MLDGLANQFGFMPDDGEDIQRETTWSPLR